MSRSIRSIGVAFIAIIVTSAAAAPPPGDACSLLTKEAAAAALGEAAIGPKAMVIPGSPSGPGSTVSSCEYTSAGEHSIQLILTTLTSKSVPMFRAMCAEKKSADLAGLGDVACWYNDKHQELHAFKGVAFISIKLERNGNPTEAIKSVMKQALDRL
jgi:hypothetical protein